MIFKLRLTYRRERHIILRTGCRVVCAVGTGVNDKGQELGYNGDLPVRRYRDGDVSRGTVH